MQFPALHTNAETAALSAPDHQTINVNIELLIEYF
jgi:hypothetical protein